MLIRNDEGLGTLNAKLVKHSKKPIPRLSKKSLMGFGDDTTDTTDGSDSSFDWNAALKDVSGAASSIVPAILKPNTTTVYTGAGTTPKAQSSNMIYYVLGAAAIAGGAYWFMKKK